MLRPSGKTKVTSGIGLRHLAPLCALLTLLLAAASIASLSACYGRGRSLLPSASSGGRKVPPPRSLWRLNMADRGFFPRYKPLEMSSPVLCPDGRELIAGSSSGEVVRVRSVDGSVVWRSRVKGAVNARPYLDEDMLLVSNDGGSLDRFDPRTGEIVWQYPLRSVVRNTPLVVGPRVFFTSEEEKLYALDAATGKWLWDYQRRAPDDFIIAGIARPVSIGGVIVAGFADGTLVALQPEDGSVRWSAHLAAPGTQFPDIEAILPLADDRLIAASFSGGLYELEPASGEIRWHNPKIKSVIGLHAQGSDLLASTGDGAVLKMNGDASRVLWRKRFGGGSIRALVPHAGYLLASSTDRGLLVLRPEDGAAVARYSPGGGLSGAVAAAEERLFFLSNGGYLYAVAFP